MILTGCQFFGQNAATETGRSGSRQFLSTLKPAKDSIQLDVLLIDRRADDPLLGSLLWEGIDQVGAVPVETRELLMQNGCLVGHAASRPPSTLLKLMGMAPEIDGVTGAGAPKPQITGRKFTIQSGTESEIQLSDVLPESEVTIIDPEQSRDVSFEQVRYIMRVKPLRLQDGWVRVEFVPEIHHGGLQMRPTPTDDLSWSLKSTQNVEQCYPQRFAVNLNVGESAVITAAPAAEGNLGEKIFRREQNGERRQRLLVVRLVDMGRIVKPMN